jgi:DNA-binding NarL/FixJ family response regulator
MAALSVLVVEDDALIGMLLAEMLEDMGHNVCAIANAEEDAVADATRYKPGLMIVDARGKWRVGGAANSSNRTGSVCFHQRCAHVFEQAWCDCAALLTLVTLVGCAKTSVTRVLSGDLDQLIRSPLPSVQETGRQRPCPAL